MSDLEAQLRAAAARYADTPEDVERLLETTLNRLAWRRRRGHKVCSRCHEQKPVTAFGQDTRERDGLHRVCRACRSAGPLQQ